MSKSTITKRHTSIIMTEVATRQYFIKKNTSTLHIHRSYHPLLWQTNKHVQHIHHSASKLPQTQMLQFPLQRINIHMSFSLSTILHPSFLTLHFLFRVFPSRKRISPNQQYTLRLTLSLYSFTCLHYAHSIRNQHITISQSLSKKQILLCSVKRVNIYGVNEQFALW